MNRLFRNTLERDDARHQLALEPIFTDILPNSNRMNARTEILLQGHLAHSVLGGWKRWWTKDHQWRPWEMSAHGVHTRVCTDEEESRIAEEIINDYIVPGKQSVLGTFREVTLARYRESNRDPKKFKCSPHFFQGFKRRHQFSSRRFHIRRRNREAGRADIAEWTERMRGLIVAVDHDQVLNCAETACRVIPSGLLTWATVGQDNVCVTLARVTATSEKLSLFLIAKGKTERVGQTQLEDLHDHRTPHPSSGCTNADTFHKYLGWLRSV
jgi:hypothetical protein